MGETIIQVQYPDKYREGEFGRKPYTYYLDAALIVAPGDVITVPTQHGHTKARVSQVNLSSGVIDERWAADVRTITAADLDAELRIEQPKGENVKPARSGAGLPRQVGLSDYELTGNYGYAMEGDV